MPTDYPQGIDVFQNPSPDTLEDAVGFEHDLAHGKLNDAVHALQLKVGANNSADPASIDARLNVVEQVASRITDDSEFNSVTVAALRIRAGNQTWELSISGFDDNGYPITDWKRIA